MGTVKDIPGVRTYVAVDGGMSDNPRPVLYGSGYETFLARAPEAARPTTVTVVGKHCESGDVLVRDGAVPSDLVVGDVLATPVTGAYGHSMGSNYNKVPRPAVVFVREGDARLVVRRETADDLLRNDVGWRDAPHRGRDDRPARAGRSLPLRLSGRGRRRGPAGRRPVMARTGRRCPPRAGRREGRAAGEGGRCPLWVRRPASGDTVDRERRGCNEKSEKHQKMTEDVPRAISSGCTSLAAVDVPVVRVGLLGCGTVGAALVGLLAVEADAIAARTGLRFEITRRGARPRPGPGRGAGAGVLTADPGTVVTAPDVDVVVETMGGVEPTGELLLAAVKAGKPVVTANKELLATEGAELLAAAEAAGVDLLFEAAVAGGIPLVRPVREPAR
ncbi:MAG: hypothetical protein R2726_15710 [Acidimicrobiales bacterium]